MTVLFLLIAGLLVGAPSSAAPVPQCLGERATIVGSSGADQITGTDHRDVIVGLGGRDVIDGLSGSDKICGGGGNDRIDGGRGGDSLVGGAGDDVLDTGAGANGAADWLFVDAGDDELIGSQENANLNLETARRGIRVDLQAGTIRGAGRDTITGVPYVEGGPYADVIRGGAELNGFDGHGGHDRLYGGGGQDWLVSEPYLSSRDSDRMFGQGGDDFFYVNVEGSVASGGSGDDSISLAPGTTGHGDEGDDRLTPDGDANVVGGSGFDLLNLIDQRYGLRVDVTAGTAIASGESTVRFRTIDRIQGTRKDDVILGSPGPDELVGSDGDDRIRGRGGDDHLGGGAGRDDVAGGAGTDHCSGEQMSSCETTGSRTRRPPRA